MRKRNEPVTRWVAPENLTDVQIADARGALEDLAKLLGRASARACHELGINFDMDDPEVARDVMMATFEALIYSKPSARKAAGGRSPCKIAQSGQEL